MCAGGSRRTISGPSAGNAGHRERSPLLTDTHGKHIRELEPEAVIDAILAKKNLGTSRDMAPLTVGLGPGFTAGEDVDYVIETMRGHNLGRIIKEAVLCRIPVCRD